MTARRASAVVVAALACALPACATIPESAGGDDALPNAAAGPFRAITQAELGNLRSAPNALEDDDLAARDGSVIDLDGDPSTLRVAGFFAGGGGPDARPTEILRYGALDGRSFDRAAEVVLVAAEPWEGGTVGAPAALRVDSGVWLYYAAAGGVGLAQSSDGHHFARVASSPSAGLVLAGATNPGVVQLDDGSFRMFFETQTEHGPSIGEARSDDGVAWSRLAGTAVAPTGSGYDARAAAAPAPILARTAAGRRVLRVYYTATDGAGQVTIGLAARFGDDGPLERATSPVFGTANALAPRQPSVVAFERFTLLFATEAASSTSSAPAVACGVAPGDVTLPPPNPP
ncbi:MAG TPA: hypothetical protein VHB21_19270 [Minicystis sp.]|nr:hypothetical protein [Minicystis sp.]